jgi:hypothetical protein
MSVPEEQDYVISQMPTDDITVPVQEAFDSLSLSVHAVSIFNQYEYDI